MNKQTLLNCKSGIEGSLEELEREICKQDLCDTQFLFQRYRDTSVELFKIQLRLNNINEEKKGLILTQDEISDLLTE
ncbi:MAG: hypothetical protein DRG78_04450 [Epsilonproteobacteria bacterium]|nr:MAG: hypothetical protein DRG78_04450 [Campylobacterota bacterium]